MHSEPIALRVGDRGRLHAVLHSSDDHVHEYMHSKRGMGLPEAEPVTERHEHHRKHVMRAEKFGRYDPISSSLAFQKADGTEHRIRVGDNGRLRSVLESGVVSSREAQDIGLPPPGACQPLSIPRSL